MTPADVIRRARSAVGLGIVYHLGSGAPHTAPSPKGEDGSCDCSGYVAWVFGFSRYQPTFGWLRALNGGWMNTDGMVEDGARSTGYWTRAATLAPASVVVYPSNLYAGRQGWTGARTGPRIGHVGIVTEPGRVLHCSLGNWQRGGDAIAETDMAPWDRVPYAQILTFCGLEV